MLESVFSFFFKYRPLLYSQGQIAFGATQSVVVASLVAAAAIAVALWTYWRVKGDSTPRDRIVLALLRVATLAVLLLCLLRPVLVVKSAVPHQNFVGVLIDDSRSMRITDQPNEARRAFVDGSFGAPDRPLIKSLADKFELRFFRFSSSAERLRTMGELAYNGHESHLGDALTAAREELAGLPLAGLVLVTDGADTTDTPLTDALRGQKSEAVPIFTVGVGREELERDIQISRVEAPRAVLKGSVLMVNVVVNQTGYRGTTVPLNVETDARITGMQQVTLPGDGGPANVRVRFTADTAGPHVFRFRIPPQPGEVVAENNVREALIQVDDRREKILYFEGEPRFEPKFIVRAVEDDQNLQVVLLQRTAENKYLRRFVENEDELAGGFPKTRDELFKYRGIILGSVEAAAFTTEQLKMIADFVNVRGGGLLMLGGRRAFAEGGWGGTPVGEVLPVVIDPMGAQEKEPPASELTIRPTRAGLMHPATQVAASEQESSARWSTLPMLTSVNPLPLQRVKPGAEVLLTGSDTSRRDQVVLAYQRYGRGKALALGVQDSWLWQMHASIEVTDVTHQNFWRRLVRWLVYTVPGQVMTSTARDRQQPGEQVSLSTQVTDATYLDVNDAKVIAHVTMPSGMVTDVPMEWNVGKDGAYRGGFVARDPGMYDVRVEASRQGKPLGEDTIHLRVGQDDSEYFDAAMRAPLLKRLAEETGGQFYTPATVGTLADDISHTGRGVNIVEERDLWDMPALLLLLGLLVMGEWAFRRKKGLA